MVQDEIVTILEKLDLNKVTTGYIKSVAFILRGLTLELDWDLY